MNIADTFNKIAKKYDLINDLLSFGFHRIWKKKAIKECNIKSNEVILDLAAGTGDLTKYIILEQNKDINFNINYTNNNNTNNNSSKTNKLNINSNSYCINENTHDINKNKKTIIKNLKIILLDLSYNMLVLAKKKLKKHDCASKKINLLYTQADALNLPFAYKTFDCVIMGFGIRNIKNKEKALTEIYNSLSNNGRLIVLEFAYPTYKLLQKLYFFYLTKILPILSKIFSNQVFAYKYLAQSIILHPKQNEFLNIVKSAGFTNCSYKNLFAGIVCIYKCHKN